MTDMINSPSHYKGRTTHLMEKIRHVLTNGSDVDVVNMECFEAMVNMFDTPDQIRGYLRGNSFKYRWRYPHKDAPVEDLYKAKWYETKLVMLEETIEAFAKGGKGND